MAVGKMDDDEAEFYDMEEDEFDFDDYMMEGYNSDSDGSGEPRVMSLEERENLFEVLETSFASEEDLRVELQEGVWDCMPEEILWNILMWLPVATQCRSRCVCSRWRVLLSAPSFTEREHFNHTASRPSSTFMWNGMHSETWSFCHGENRWFRLSFQPNSCLDLPWIIADVDKALVCYRAYVDRSWWLLVCNPITQSFRVLPPVFPKPELIYTMVNLIVDLKTKTFKVVLSSLMDTMIFDSKTEEWKEMPSAGTTIPDLPMFTTGDRKFLWRNVIYKQEGLSCTYLAFDIESGLWSKMELDLPCDTRAWFHITSSEDVVMLVQVSPTQEEFVRIWILDNAADAPILSASDWENVSIKVPISLRPVVGNFLNCVSHGKEYVCFAIDWKRYWVKYTFKTKSWRVMPSCHKKFNTSEFNDPPDEPYFITYQPYEWYDWEPRIDIDVKPGDFNASDYPELATSQHEHDDSPEVAPNDSGL